MLRNTLVIGFVALATNTVMYSSATGPMLSTELFQGAMSTLVGRLPLSAMAVSLLVAAFFAVEGRRRTSLSHQLDHERDLRRRVWDATDDGMVLVDVNAAIVEWNPAMERLTGLSLRQAFGKIVTTVPGLGGVRHAECLRLALKGVETVADRSAFEWSGHMSAPSLRAYYSPRRSADGGIVGAFVLITGWTQAARGHRTGQAAEMSAA